ncbi:efflux RND transporter permease subunit [Phycisphaerales bacterium AB-hyl4]|uniref:Efflux RND transporter permease subunit n=1 Tax=Natronomicrosphaera hydrolytica TaxID=3242702 RepID=A0ABV4U6Q9_9BACT
MNEKNPNPPRTLLDPLLRFCLEQKLVVALVALLLIAYGVAVAPFDWDIDWLPRNPVAVDAIPNLGENQQIVFTEWPGRSPQDVEDQLTYPLTVNLMGLPGVREVRSQSMLGFSMIFIIFDDDIEFYWSRSRIIEKLNSLPADALPDGVAPALGPDATALGQVFWYSLQGHDPDGNPVGGWDLHELRAAQDWYVRYGLLAAEGISEVASIGGYVPEYLVEADPDAMRAYNVNMRDLLDAVRESNLDVGAGVTEINNVEYLIRGVGFIKTLEDLERATLAVRDDNVPVRVGDVANVSRAPGPRRGALTVGGAEAVGGVAVVREGYNPLQAIHNLKDRIEEITPGLPAKVLIDWDQTTPRDVRHFADAHDFNAYADAELDHDAWLNFLRNTSRDDWPGWINISQLEVVPFYDRTNLIYETLGTLNDALVQQILVTIIVVLVLVMHLRSAMIISAMLPLAVLISFILMKLVGIDANVVALAGIAIAIGTIVDMGLIVTENVLKHLAEARDDEPRLDVVFRGVREVGSAVLTAISTTVVSFLPVFMLTGESGKMFIPLAFTKTFVLIASIFIALTIVPAAVHLIIAGRITGRTMLRAALFGLGVTAIAIVTLGTLQDWGWVTFAGALLLAVVFYHLLEDELPTLIRTLRPGWAQPSERFARMLRRAATWLASAVAIVVVGVILAQVWEPLGPERGFVRNLIFVTLLIGGLLTLFWLFMLAYAHILRFLLAVKTAFLIIPVLMILLGLSIWLGFDRTFSFIPAAVDRAGGDSDTIRLSGPWVWANHAMPGLGREFMPRLDEGTFLWMPTIMPHGSIGEALDVLQYQDLAIASVPEIEGVYGKIGRAESALDPAPVSMIETVIDYKSEYITDDAGRRINFKFDRDTNEHVRDDEGEIIPDPRGRPYRQWRDHINSPRDIWNELAAAADLPGATSAPLDQPINIRQVMLQTGMRASMGVKVRAPDLDTLDRVAVQIERLLRELPSINPNTVNADRVVGKPYLEIHPDREAIARFGLRIDDVQQVIQAAIGGEAVSTTVEGRERYPIRVRYARDMRQDIEAMQRVMLPAGDGAQVPLEQVADIRYARGPQMIRAEDTFLTAYVTFGAQQGQAEIDVVEQARAYLDEKIASGELAVPAGVSWRFAGRYEQQVQTMQTMRVILPVALAIIFLILYFQFRSTVTTFIVFSGIAVAWAGGFIMLHLYSQPWFANFDVFGVNMRDLFQLQPVNLSVAVWVGFLALFGIAVDDGVVMATYLRQSFRDRKTESVAQIREAVLHAGLRRVRPCLMTSATTILALLPVLTATGRGADIMIPMAIPSVGGMSLVLITMFTVPVLYCLAEEIKWKLRRPADTD